MLEYLGLCEPLAVANWRPKKTRSSITQSFFPSGPQLPTRLDIMKENKQQLYLRLHGSTLRAYLSADNG